MDAAGTRPPPSPIAAATNACGAVVVVFHAPPGLAARLAPILGQVAALVVVDNAPAAAGEVDAVLAADPRIEHVSNPVNRGIAAALNQGLERLAAHGCRHALLLDHDSSPDPQMLPRLLATARAPVAAQAAIVVPRIAYGHPEIRCRWPHTARDRGWSFDFVYAAERHAPAPVDLAISSGMLLDLDAWRRLGGFREDLFIDLVDTEFCLRARAAGFLVLAEPAAVLHHSLGDVEQRRLPGIARPMYPTHHAPLRHYYLGRNRVLLARAHARRFPSWFFYELASAVKLLVKVLLFEPGRWQKLRATVLGTWDGLRGRSGMAVRRFPQAPI